MGACMRNKKKHANNYSYTKNSLDLVKLEMYTKGHRNCGRQHLRFGTDLDSPRYARVSEFSDFSGQLTLMGVSIMNCSHCEVGLNT